VSKTLNVCQFPKPILPVFSRPTTALSTVAHYATVLRLSVIVVCPVVCTECIVAKWCVLEQKLPLTAYRKSYIMRNRLVTKWMTLTFV